MAGASLSWPPGRSSQLDFAIQAALAATVLTAAVTDLYSQRVPNWLTFPAIVLALSLHSANGGLPGVLFGAGGLAAGFGLLIAFYAMGGMGAGDVKLMATVGAFTGPERVLWIFFYSALFGGVYALGIVVYSMLARDGWSGAVRRLKAEGTAVLLTAGEAGPSRDLLQTFPKLRYAIAVAAGVAVEHFVGAPQF